MGQKAQVAVASWAGRVAAVVGVALAVVVLVSSLETARLPVRAAGAPAAPVPDTAVRQVHVNDLLQGGGNGLPDGCRVRLVGEVIGDVMVRGRWAWVNVNDGIGAIGVRIPSDQATGWQGGDYGRRGDQVEVIGIYRRADPQTGGELDVEGLEIRRQRAAEPVVHPVNPQRVWVALGLTVLCGVAAVAEWRRERGTAGGGRGDGPGGRQRERA